MLKLMYLGLIISSQTLGQNVPGPNLEASKIPSVSELVEMKCGDW